MYDNLYRSLFEIVSFFVRPQQDKLLVQRAGILLDTALFPLLMRIAYSGPLGVVELAVQVDRDHSTVSRQVDKLIRLGLMSAVDQTTDRRVRLLDITDAGRLMTNKLAAARRAMMREALQNWNKIQLVELQSSLAHLAETLRNHSNNRESSLVNYTSA